MIIKFSYSDIDFGDDNQARENFAAQIVASMTDDEVTESSVTGTVNSINRNLTGLRDYADGHGGFDAAFAVGRAFTPALTTAVEARRAEITEAKSAAAKPVKKIFTQRVSHHVDDLYYGRDAAGRRRFAEQLVDMVSEDVLGDDGLADEIMTRSVIGGDERRWGRVRRANFDAMLREVAIVIKNRINPRINPPAPAAPVDERTDLEKRAEKLLEGVERKSRSFTENRRLVWHILENRGGWDGRLDTKHLYDREFGAMFKILDADTDRDHQDRVHKIAHEMMTYSFSDYYIRRPGALMNVMKSRIDECIEGTDITRKEMMTELSRRINRACEPIH